MRTSMEKEPRSTKSPRKRYLVEWVVLGVVRVAADLEYLLEVVELAVDVSDDGDWVVEVDEVAFALCVRAHYSGSCWSPRSASSGAPCGSALRCAGASSAGSSSGCLCFICQYSFCSEIADPCPVAWLEAPL